MLTWVASLVMLPWVALLFGFDLAFKGVLLRIRGSGRCLVCGFSIVGLFGWCVFWVM